MINKKNMSRAELLNRLNHECENGYPSFRREIAKVLSENYNVNFTTAESLVYERKFIKKILNDINWSQHMGPQYWAEIISEENNISPKRITIRA